MEEPASHGFFCLQMQSGQPALIGDKADEVEAPRKLGEKGISGGYEDTS